MRTKLRSKVTLLFVMCAVFIAVPVVAALADNVQNDVGGSGITTITAGGSTTVNYRITANSGDGQAGCNAADSSPATVTINKPAAVTASTSTLTFTSCGTNQPVTFSSNTPGDFNITVSVSDSGTGTYNTNPASFTLHVNPAPPPANTPPKLSLPANQTVEATGPGGATVSFNATATDAEDNPDPTPTCLPASGSVFPVGTTQVNCSVTDSGNLTTTGMFTVTVQDTTAPSIAAHDPVTAEATSADGAVVNYTNPTASDLVDEDVAVTCDPPSGSTFALGTTTVTCTATDDFNNTAHSTFTVTVSDATPPVITHEIQGTLGNNGWYTSDVDLTWSVTDPESPNSIVKTGCADQHINSDQGPTPYSCSATSSGGPAGPETVTIKRDATPPQVTLGAASGTNGNNGWYKGAVTQTFNASDATSGLADPDQDPSFTKSSGANEEGQNVNIASGPVSDNAGNTASASAGPFKVDLSDPEVNCDDAPTGWSQNDVNIHCQASDAVSGLANNADGDFDLSTGVPNGTETANASTDERDVADAAGRTVTAGPISGIKVDKKAPVLTDEGPTTSANGANGWYTSAVTNSFKATDGGSGFGTNGDPTKTFTKSSGTNEGSAVKIASDAVSDAVGNSAASIDSAAFKIDLSNPTNVQFSGGPAAGNSYDFGDTPDKPTCTADDAISGFASCDVTGYSTAVGSHTMTATAKDKAGRTATATRTYTVKPYTLKGFYQPVDMGDVLNTVKNGSTVPVKFELFKGTTELTSTSAVSSILAKTVSCTAFTGDPEDAIETLATGGTSLRYDATGGQFIYNWQTPKKPNTCYNLTMTATDDSTITAYFKLK